MSRFAVLFFLISFFAYPVSSATWHVGPTRTYTLPSQIKNLVQDGDSILIDGGMYLNDAVKWTKRNLSFIGLGNFANPAHIQYTGNIPNGKGIFVFETPGLCDDIYVENIVFDGAQVSDSDGANGAGIRFQANNITVRNCIFMNCQNGILEGHVSVGTSNVIIENCEFKNNGYQQPNDPTYSGYEHHIYISASADTLWVQNCYFHEPRGQANSIKTRAQRSFLLNNMIMEGSGYGSWEINIAQGGLNIIMGNIIVQGNAGANHGIISYDDIANPLENFYFVNNTVINKFPGNIRYFHVVPSGGIQTFKIYNNIFASFPTATNSFCTGNIPGSLDSSHNIFISDYTSLGFTDPFIDDYRLDATAILAINKGTNAGVSNSGFSLTPLSSFNANGPSASRYLNGIAIDLGAYEFGNATLSRQIDGISRYVVYPNPVGSTFYIQERDPLDAEMGCKLINLSGQNIALKQVNRSSPMQFVFERKPAAGIYYLIIKDKHSSYIVSLEIE